MTFSIIAHDVATGQVGIAVASKTLATGARVPHIRTGVGAIASQARVNHYYGPRGLALLAAGASAADTVRLLVAADEDQDIRQVHVMDRHGPVRRPHGCGVPGVVRPSGEGELFGGGQHPGRCPPYSRQWLRPTRRRRSSPLGAEIGRGHEGRRAGRRRQAWTAVGGAPHPRHCGLGLARHQGRRSRRSALRARAPRGSSRAARNERGRANSIAAASLSSHGSDICERWGSDPSP